MSIFDYLYESIIHDRLLLEGSPLSKNFFTQKYGKREDFAEQIEKGMSAYKSLVEPVIGTNDSTIFSNVLKYVALENGNLEQWGNLLHDILTYVDANTIKVKLIPHMKSTDITFEKIKGIYDPIKMEIEKKNNDTSKWKIVEDSYVMLPDQDTIAIKNFNGTGETKIIERTSGAKWWIGTAIDEDILKKSPLYAELQKDQKTALIKASKKGEYAIRQACPLDSNRNGHCGAVPYVNLEQYDEAIYLMLKHDKGGKSMASVLVDRNGRIIESKAPNNTSIKKEYHDDMIWLLNHHWITGTDWGGYAPDKNFFIFKHEDDDIKNHMYNHSGKEFTEIDKKVNNLKKQYDSGDITIDDLINMLGEEF